MSTEAKSVLSSADIQSILPHRPPALLIDRVISLTPGVSGKAAVGLAKRGNLFAGHFPGLPILPGVLIVEACAQLVALVSAEAEPNCQSIGVPAIRYLASIERFKFLQPVTMGTGELIVECRLGRRFGQMMQADVRAETASQKVAAGTISVSLKQNNRANHEL